MTTWSEVWISWPSELGTESVPRDQLNSCTSTYDLPDVFSIFALFQPDWMCFDIGLQLTVIFIIDNSSNDLVYKMSKKKKVSKAHRTFIKSNVSITLFVWTKF